MDTAQAERQLVEAADRLFYERGIQAVGMDAVRAASGVSLKRLYQLFPSKRHLVETVLRRRDGDIRAALESYTAAASTPVDRILAVFDYLYDWFGEPDFRGCAFINSYAELGGTAPEIADIVRAHKQALRDLLTDLVRAADRPAELAEQLVILANGAMVTAAIDGSPETARHARAIAQHLLTPPRPDGVQEWSP
jgi:AcrR family transcriptional regulator